MGEAQAGDERVDLGYLVGPSGEARLRAHHRGVTVIASDVGRRVEFTPDGFPPDGEISGWEAWRLRRRSRLAGGGAVRLIPGMSAC